MSTSCQTKIITGYKMKLNFNILFEGYWERSIVRQNGAVIECRQSNLASII